MAIERWILAVAGLVGAFRIWRALQTGIVTEVSVIRRDDQPRLFWLLISVAIVMFGGFFYFAAFGDF